MLVAAVHTGDRREQLLLAIAAVAKPQIADRVLGKEPHAPIPVAHPPPQDLIRGIVREEPQRHRGGAASDAITELRESLQGTERVTLRDVGDKSRRLLFLQIALEKQVQDRLSGFVLSFHRSSSVGGHSRQPNSLACPTISSVISRWVWDNAPDRLRARILRRLIAENSLAYAKTTEWGRT